MAAMHASLTILTGALGKRMVVDVTPANGENVAITVLLTKGVERREVPVRLCASFSDDCRICQSVAWHGIQLPNEEKPCARKANLSCHLAFLVDRGEVYRT